VGLDLPAPAGFSGRAEAIGIDGGELVQGRHGPARSGWILGSGRGKPGIDGGELVGARVDPPAPGGSGSRNLSEMAGHGTFLASVPPGGCHAKKVS
jgi:hypothetical protein